MKIVRMHKGSWGKAKAFFDLETNEGLILKGFKIVSGNSGDFVGFPSQKDKDGNWNDTIHAPKEVKAKVSQIAMASFNDETTDRESVGTTSEDEVIPF
tara:strand:+ start:248 stop:541 length:294 start_codon:yes stop_codon:yes gene_type:complete